MRRKYRWEEWFRKDRTTIRYGEDYSCSQSVMCQAIRNAACQRGIRVRLVDDRDAIHIEVRNGSTSDQGEAVPVVGGQLHGMEPAQT